MTNQELVKKSIIAADALAAAGKLNPKQADKFIDYVVDESMLKGNARIERFSNEQMTINKIGVGRRVAVPAAEAKDPGTRRGVTTSKVQLQPAEIMVPFEISDTFGEINVEGKSVDDHVIQMMARQLSNDMEEMYLHGNLLGPAISELDYTGEGSDTDMVRDNYLALKDGWLKQADLAHIVDADGDNISPALFSAMLNAMPNKFKRNKNLLRFLSSTEHEQLYRQTVASRATNAGDDALNSTKNLTPFGTQLLPVPLMPRQPIVVEHVAANADGVTATALGFSPIYSLVLCPETLDLNPVAPYVEGVDYTVDLANGTFTRLGGGSIPAGATVKATFETGGQLLLTAFSNLIVAIGRDIRIEKDRDIFKRVNQYAITAKVDVKFEEIDAVVKAINVGLE